MIIALKILKIIILFVLLAQINGSLSVDPLTNVLKD
jgi:hypothetical protein